MNAYSPPVGGASHAASSPPGPAATDLFWGLQYCRAGMLSLTRLELAMESGDRQRIIEAIDRLHALDGEIERKVASLPAPVGPDPERAAFEEYLGREKMAVAFEKLVLASGISGPGLAPHRPAAPAPGYPASSARDDGTDIDENARSAGIVATYGPKAAILSVIVAATGAILVAAL